MKTLLCDQGTPEWIEARCGRITASDVHRVFTPTKQTLSAKWRQYSYELIAEELIGGPDPWKGEGETVDMRRGKFTEKEARNYYQMMEDVDVEQVGVCIHENELWLNSPDGLILPHRGLEMKCPAPKTQIEYLMGNKIPAKLLPQPHFSMIVTGLDEWDWLSYCVGLPALLIRVKRDAYTAKLQSVVEDFTAKHLELLARIKRERQDFIDEIVKRRPLQPTKQMQSFVSDVA